MAGQQPRRPSLPALPAPAGKRLAPPILQPRAARLVHTPAPPLPGRVEVVQPLFGELLIAGAAALGAYTFIPGVKTLVHSSVKAVKEYFVGGEGSETYRKAARESLGVKHNSSHTFGTYTYKTDKHSRVYFVSGRIVDKYLRRNKEVTPLIKSSSDHDGHIIADQFGGPHHGVNFVGMTAWQNNSEGGVAWDGGQTYKRMEAWIRNRLDNGHILTISVTLTYPDDVGPSSRDFYRPLTLDVKINDDTDGLHDNPTRIGGIDTDNGVPFQNHTPTQRLRYYAFDDNDTSGDYTERYFAPFHTKQVTLRNGRVVTLSEDADEEY